MDFASVHDVVKPGLELTMASCGCTTDWNAHGQVTLHWPAKAGKATPKPEAYDLYDRLYHGSKDASTGLRERDVSENNKPSVTVRPWIHDDSGKLKLLVKKQWRPNGTKVFQHLRDWQKQKDIADDTSNSIETRQGAETRMSELMEKALTAGTILNTAAGLADPGEGSLVTGIREFKEEDGIGGGKRADVKPFFSGTAGGKDPGCSGAAGRIIDVLVKLKGDEVVTNELLQSIENPEASDTEFFINEVVPFSTYEEIAAASAMIRDWDEAGATVDGMLATFIDSVYVWETMRRAQSGADQEFTMKSAVLTDFEEAKGPGPIRTKPKNHQAGSSMP